jgi:DNA-binding NarL/FixJ family response regulator
VRVALADDSGLFRASLALLLEASGAEVTAAVPSGAELLAAIRPSPPDAVILDIRMPPTFTDEGIRTAAELRRQHPATGILVLSTYAETRYASQLPDRVPRGVGYLLKDNVTDAGALMDALSRVGAGEIAIDQSIVATSAALIREPHGGGTLIRVVFMDERQQPLPVDPGTMMATAYLAAELDDDLHQAFGARNVIVLK